MRTRYLPVAWAFHAGLSFGQTLVDKRRIPFGSVVLALWAATRVSPRGPRTPSRVSWRLQAVLCDWYCKGKPNRSTAGRRSKARPHEKKMPG